MEQQEKEAIAGLVNEILKPKLLMIEGSFKGITDLLNSLQEQVGNLQGQGPSASLVASDGGALAEELRSLREQVQELQNSAQMRPLNGTEQRQRHDKALKREAERHGPREGMPRGDVTMYHPTEAHAVARTPAELEDLKGKGYATTITEACGATFGEQGQPVFKDQAQRAKYREIYDRATKPKVQGAA